MLQSVHDICITQTAGDLSGDQSQQHENEAEISAGSEVLSLLGLD